MNLQFDWISVLINTALISLLVVGYRLLPREGWMGRMGRGGILVFAVLILTIMVLNTVAMWRIR